jgi:hypothetical protein
VRPYNVAVVGGFELVTTLTTLVCCGLAMVVMDGRGSSNISRSTVGSIMLAVQLIGFLCLICGIWWVSLTALWRALDMRRRLRLKPSPSDKLADAVVQVGTALLTCLLACLPGWYRFGRVAPAPTTAEAGWLAGWPAGWLCKPLLLAARFGRSVTPSASFRLPSAPLPACHRSWLRTHTSWQGSLQTGGWCGRWGWACTTAPSGAARQVGNAGGLFEWWFRMHAGAVGGGAACC